MVMSYMNRQLDTFDKVASWYNNTKPLVSKCHTLEQDIRPLGDRKRKYERIKKINDNCYALMDGYYSGDDVFGYYWGDFYTMVNGVKTAIPADKVTDHMRRNPALYGRGPTEAEVEKLAPIVWRKHKNGTETVTIRNGTGQGAHMSRYSFLQRCIPSHLTFRIENGKQYILCGGPAAGKYYLAKSITVAACDVPHSPNKWNTSWSSRDDGTALTFFITSGDAYLSHGGKPIPKAPRVVVNKDAKAKLKAELATFKEWAFTMFPLLPEGDRDYEERMRNELKEHMPTCRWGQWRMLDLFVDNWKTTREVIKNEDHPLRLHLAYYLLNDTDYRWQMRGDQTTGNVVAQYNTKINKVCNFTKTVKG